MSFSDDLERLRSELKEAGVPFSALYARAKIAPSTFTRWGQGKSPRLQTWEMVKRAKDELIHEARAERVETARVAA